MSSNSDSSIAFIAFRLVPALLTELLRVSSLAIAPKKP